MAAVNASLVGFQFLPIYFPTNFSKTLRVSVAAELRRRALCSSTFALKNSDNCASVDAVEEMNGAVLKESSETLLYSFSPFTVLLLAALPGGNTAFQVCCSVLASLLELF